MKFKQKLKIRLITAISYTILGIIIIVLSFVLKIKSEYFSTIGFGMFLIGIIKIRNHMMLIKNEKLLKNQEIKENDERNLSLASRAKGISFNICIFASFIALTIFEIKGQTDYATIIGISGCALLLIYWTAYYILQKKA